ncbi:MAG: glycosyltransferase family 2 protein [Tepidanaerobacter acetatoxydans]|uniref:glycosyltransferase family 2 protein n=1 Tax=Tepidanaerobacter TaxID=499228 RepID=UPI000AD0BB79|nr:MULTISPECIES: glycosyltransferase family 2 protein [Tepidanaerobacter]NLU11282.1 glycosyltransferase family 2 protein [Tepidanaerobacter acetatoxydans]
MKVSVLIPAFNEEKNIEQTIKGLEYFKDTFCAENQVDLEILVIDDGSSDQTGIKASNAGAKVLSLNKNMGKGSALREGLKSIDGDILVFLDADLQASSSEVYKLVLPILKGEADVTIAKFKPPSKKRGFGFVKALAFYGVRFFTGKEVTSALSGQRAFKKDVLNDIGTIPEGFGIEVGMLIDILKKGYTVKEVDVDMYHDVTGRDLKGFLHRGKQFWHILKVLISKMINYGIF